MSADDAPTATPNNLLAFELPTNADPTEALEVHEDLLERLTYVIDVFQSYAESIIEEQPIDRKFLSLKLTEIEGHRVYAEQALQQVRKTIAELRGTAGA